MIPPIESYFRVKSWQGDGARMAEREVLLGLAENEDGMIPFRVADAPQADVYWVEPWDGRNESVYPHKVRMSPSPKKGWLKTHVFNHGKPVDEQVWERIPPIHEWTNEFLEVQAEGFRKKVGASKREQTDVDFWRDPENLTEAQYEYALLEWHRRIYGIWIWIGGRLTWLSGFHYFYIQHFKIDPDYPTYRDRDRRWFYAWQACYDDPLCDGMVYLKHRRDGATYRCACIGLEIVTRGDMENKHFGITSKGDDDALEMFQDKVKYPFDDMIEFFRPKMESNMTSTKQEMIFNEPKKSSADRYRRGAGLKAWIKTAAKSRNKKVRFDGGKTHVIVNDEAGKRPDENIDELLRITSQCMAMAGREGKSLWPTTNEEMVGDNADRFEGIFNRSNISLRKSSRLKRTPTGLFSYFTPCWDGMDENWFGPFGESIIDTPTDTQRKFMMGNELQWGKVGQYVEDGMGAYQLWVTKANEDTDPVGYLHMFPGTPADAFAKVNSRTAFNAKRINDTLRGLGETMADGRTREQHLTIRGKLKSVDNDLKKDVYFVEDPNGPFLVNREYLPVYVAQDGRPVPNKGPTWGGELALKLGILANRVKRSPARHGYAESFHMVEVDRDNETGLSVVLGFDPQKTSNESAEGAKVPRRSSAAMHGFLPHNPKIDGSRTTQMQMDDPDFARNSVTHVWVFEYACHPKTPHHAFEDCIRACIFWSGKVAYERVVNEFGNWVFPRGLYRLLECNEQEMERKGLNRNTVRERGFHTDRDMIDLYHNLLTAWVEYHCFPHTIPFPNTLRQFLKFNPLNTEKFDLAVSAGMAMLGRTKGRPEAKEELRILQPPEPKEKARSIWEDFDYVNVG